MIEGWLKVEDIELALFNLGGAGSLKDIYEEIGKLKGFSLTSNQQAKVRQQLQYYNKESPHYQNKGDLFFKLNGIRDGLWGLRSQQDEVREEAIEVHEDIRGLSFDNLPAGSAAPKYYKSTIVRVIRNIVVSSYLKKLYDYTCQICRTRLDVEPNAAYAEAHHIIPLSEGGADTPDNIIVLCPNHHVLCDHRSIELSPNKLVISPIHELAADSLSWHNEEHKKLWNIN